MRGRLRLEEMLLVMSPGSSPSDSSSPRSFLYGWLFECHGFVHNLFLAAPSFLFALYLAIQAKKSYSKLSQARSSIIISYYVSLWLVTLLNVAWSFLQAIYVFMLGIPLFIDIDEPKHPLKWNLWVLHKLVLTVIYGIIVFMYHSKWRERLPARPAFHKYIIVTFSWNATALFACGLTGNGAGLGLWLNDVTIVCYHAFYLPLLYVMFLADFFQEDDLHLENVYYSEMKDAGFCGADWG